MLPLQNANLPPYVTNIDTYGSYVNLLFITAKLQCFTAFVSVQDVSTFVENMPIRLYEIPTVIQLSSFTARHDSFASGLRI